MAIAVYDRGNASYALQNYEFSIADFDKTLNLDPRFTSVYRMRGMAYQALGKTAEADFKKYEELMGEKP